MPGLSYFSAVPRELDLLPWAVASVLRLNAIVPTPVASTRLITPVSNWSSHSGLLNLVLAVTGSGRLGLYYLIV
jgi:hypothetical protein